MVEVKPFKQAHLLELLKEERNKKLSAMAREENLKALEASGLCYTILCKATKRVLFCGGVSEYWLGRGECWAVFTENCRREFRHIHSCVKRYFQLCQVKRVEATVDVDFEAGHRWIKSLGFKIEAPLLKAYLPGGRDAVLYARVN